MSYAEYVVTARRGGMQPAGRRFAYRLAETFFRRWPLYVLPLALLFVYGVIQARDSAVTYTASGTLRVGSNPLLASFAPAKSDDGFYWETVADTTARQINEQLGTDQFLDEVAATAGLSSFLDSGALTRDRLRAAMSVRAGGATLLKVSTTWPDAKTSLAITNATISQYMSFVLDAQVRESTEAESFWQDLQTTYQGQLDDAEAALTAYVQQHPAPKVGDRPDDEAIQLTRLGDAVTAAQSQLTNAQNKQQEAALMTQQARSQAGESLQLVDTPKLPRPNEAAPRDQILTVGMYAVLGGIIGGLALLVATLLDRSVRSSDDISVATGLPVVATVPVIRRLRREGTEATLQRPASAA